MLLIISYNKNSRLDKMNLVLAEWCFALNYANEVPVWECTFYPKEYLYLKLENLFNK